jgi:repressor LexA
MFGCQVEQMFGIREIGRYGSENTSSSGNWQKEREREQMGNSNALSDRQTQVLSYIKETVAARGYPPSVREIGDAVGLSSPSTVHSHLSALVKAGFLRRDPSKPRAIEVLDGGHGAKVRTTGRRNRGDLRDVPLVGRIAAGSPILAAEDVEEIYPLPASLVGAGPVFMLRVKGDSMINAGILDGDLVVVERGGSPSNGEIVAALIDGEDATIKRLQRRGGEVTLEPANPALRPVTYTSGVEVIGRVVSVIRAL